jgi:rare lipoprotein A
LKNGFATLSALALTAVAAAGCAGTGPLSGNLVNCADARGYDATGTASWYGRAHHGRRTASGQVFDMNGLSAAHRSLPFGTRVRVTNENNGRSVVLTVNDRGPFIPGRLLDVSYGAARRLGFVAAGLAPVQVQAVEAC